MTTINRGLIINKIWVDRILDHGKTWEMRSRRTHFTGWFGIIESGSGLIVGKAFMTSGHIKPTHQELLQNIDKHQVKDLSLLKKWCYAWTIEKAVRFKEPTPYKHPQGAVTWVKLDHTVYADGLMQNYKRLRLG